MSEDGQQEALYELSSKFFNLMACTFHEVFKCSQGLLAVSGILDLERQLTGLCPRTGPEGADHQDG